MPAYPTVQENVGAFLTAVVEHAIRVRSVFSAKVRLALIAATTARNVVQVTHATGQTNAIEALA